MRHPPNRSACTKPDEARYNNATFHCRPSITQKSLLMLVLIGSNNDAFPGIWCRSCSKKNRFSAFRKGLIATVPEFFLSMIINYL
jgi:hypothetical protein